MPTDTAKFDGRAFGRSVRSVRAYRRMSLRDAAGAAGVSFPTFSRVERGQPAVVDNVARIAAWAGLSLDTYIERHAS